MSNCDNLCKLPYIVLLLLVITCDPAGAAEAVDNSYYRLIVANCYTCHRSDSPEAAAIPRLDRLSAAEIKQLLNAYKSGRERVTIMNRISKALTDAEIDRISAMFASEAR